MNVFNRKLSKSGAALSDRNMLRNQSDRFHEIGGENDFQQSQTQTAELKGKPSQATYQEVVDMNLSEGFKKEQQAKETSLSVFQTMPEGPTSIQLAKTGSTPNKEENCGPLYALNVSLSKDISPSKQHEVTEGSEEVMATSTSFGRKK